MELIAELRANNIDTTNLVIGIADRMIENWILACSKVRERYDLVDNLDGCNGKSKLKFALHRKKEEYHETTVGVDMFCALDVRTAIANSPSFSDFAHSVKDHCKWIRKALQQ